MNFKKLILVLSLTVVLMISLLLGFSYAWYATTTSTSFNLGTPSQDVLSIDFQTSDYVSTTTGIPLLDSEVETLADKTLFTVKASDNMNYTAKYTILLKDIIIADELKNASFRWALLKDGVSVASSDFSGIGTATTLDLYTTTLVLNATNADSYELRIWLSENNGNQNGMMNKAFSARVAIKTFFSY